MRKTMKRFSAFLLSMLLCLGMTAIPVFAASESQDGLEVTLVTDKEVYTQKEEIVATLSVKNTNDFAVTNLSLENIIPKGYKLAKDSVATKQIGSLETGKTTTLKVTYVAESSTGAGEDKPGTGDTDKENKPGNGSNSENPVHPETGDKSNVVLWVVLMVVAGLGIIVIVVKNKKHGKKLLSLFLCLTIASAIIVSAAPMQVEAAGGNTKTLTVKETIKVENKEIVISAIVKYELSDGETDSTYTVTFDSNGGSVVEAQTVAEGQKATEPTTPTKKGYTFAGWYTDESFENEYDFSIAVTENITLYAKWNNINEGDFDLGEDIIPDLDFEPTEAEPTFEDKAHEIANIIDINDGEMPYSACDDNGIPNFIDGKFSEIKVTNTSEAIKALNDIHYIMHFENAEQEFESVYQENVELGAQTNFFRLQQVYHNVPVYGCQLIVSTDVVGNIETLTGHYYPDLNLDTQPNITIEEAKEILRSNYSEDELVSDGLYIYTQGEVPVVAWKIRSFSKVYFINAETGELVTSITTLLTDSVTGSGTNMRGEEISFPVYTDNNRYYLYDELRNIRIADASHQAINGVPVVEDTNNNWSNHQEAITAYDNFKKVFDFYANVLGRDGADNSHSEIYVDVNYRASENVAVNQPFSNAFYDSSVQGVTFISLGDGRNYAKPLDVAAHEFTHAVSASIVNSVNGTNEGLIYLNESGALNEAYSDIIGDLFEDGTLGEHGEELDGGANRSFADPSDHGQPEDVSHHVAYCYKGGDHDDHGCDNGGVHYNSGIVNYAAYKMDQSWPESNHANELATLFYKSIYYLTPNSTFLDCRHAVLSSAKSMNMSDEKRNVVATAFADVGIKHEDDEAWASAHHIIGNVKDAETNSSIIDAEVIAVATKGLGGGIGYTDGTGNYDVKVNRAVYTVSVFAEGYRSCTIENVDLSSWINMDYYMETLYLVPAAWGDDTQNVFASGKVTNALTGEALDGVTIKFRNGAGNQSGDYVQTVAGLDVELITDASGKYYTAALPAGNYTLEASKDGFVTGYINIVSGNSDVCNNQNITLPPELSADSLRIVLTWGNDPRDLDSHVSGTLSNGSGFHTYFANESDWDGEVEVCNLDVDDTDGEGPETITLNPTTKSPYYYYIYHYSGNGSIATSGASVKVYQGSNLLGTFNAPTNQGDARYWNIFAFVDGKLVVNNTITSTPNVSYGVESKMSMRTSDNNNIQKKLEADANTVKATELE